MQTKRWEDLRVEERDPSDVEVHRFNYTRWLGGETLDSVVAAASTGLTVEVVATEDDYADIKVSGGTAGQEYKLTVTATSSGGRVQQRTLRFKTVEL